MDGDKPHNPAIHKAATCGNCDRLRAELFSAQQLVLSQGIELSQVKKDKELLLSNYEQKEKLLVKAEKERDEYKSKIPGLFLADQLALERRAWELHDNYYAMEYMEGDINPSSLAWKAKAQEEK
jgi:hypothetical protein